ncbi:uncharacterized protein isoform X3 [Leptinotarsa decemlineata]|uniref:uncharacterized protein isoform X3 n=1 Tax=Leptinotarsa decemlineata TaxID=7539 RepID=UPI003D30CAF2
MPKFPSLLCWQNIPPLKWDSTYISERSNDSTISSTTMSVSVSPFEVMSANFMQVYDPRLRRIVEECYEVAFIICNTDMEQFTTAKIFDVFDQTFPTACVLNTGYWPFYSTVKGQSLCICGRFGIFCRHVKSDFHWIDICPVENDPHGVVFRPNEYGSVHPKEYNISIKAMYEEGLHGCNITALINVYYKKNERGRHRRNSNPTSSMQKDKIFNITLTAGYLIRPEFYPAMFTLVFQPNPFFHEQYGTYFEDLKQLRDAEWVGFCHEHQKIWYITCPQMTSTTFVMRHVNVDIYKQPSQMMAYYPYFMKSIGSKTKKNKSCQTTEDYVYRIRESSKIWNYFPSDSQSISSALANLATNRLNGTTQNIIQRPFTIEESESYDSQWPVVGHNRTIRPNPSRPDNIYKIRKLSGSSHSKIENYDPPSNSEATTPTANLSSVSDSTKKAMRKPPPPYESRVLSAELLIKDKVKTEIDEEFELIETVIWEDVMKNEEEWYKEEPNTPSQ